jgi:hypothetical protein
MVNLNNIFNKFFPKSQTSPIGQKLIYMAWAIEITVALVGFTIAASFVAIGREETIAIQGEISGSGNIQYYIIGLAFFVVGIMELTKIPLATALYYAVRPLWKIIFLLALLAVNFSTFETILQGFQMSYSNNTKPVEILRSQLENLIDEKNTKKGVSGQEGAIQIEIQDLQNRISDLNSEISKINSDTNIQIAELEKQNNLSSPRIKTLSTQVELEQEKIKNLYENKSKLELSMQNLTGAQKFLGVAKDIQKNILSVSGEIAQKENSLKLIRKDLDEVLGRSASKNQPQINALNQNANIKINNINNQIKEIENNQLSPKLLSKSEMSNKQDQIRNEINELDKLIDQQKKKVNNKASSNSFYQMAVMIKVGPGRWFFNEEVNKDITPADLTQQDLKRAFWIWFGFLAFVISIIGTLVALAGLHLMDERMHEIRNRPISRKNTTRYRIGKLLVRMNKYFYTAIKVKLKPITVEKIVTKEVKVDKIIEKPVYEEKIVYQKVEVPKEVTRKEIVHVPLWTQDPELLGKKIDINNDSQIKKKDKDK